AVGEYRRPRRVHHLFARRHDPALEPLELVPRPAQRSRRRFATRLDGERGRRPLMPRRRAREAGAVRAVEVHIEQPGPTEISDPLVRREFARAAVWLGMSLAIVGLVFLAPPLPLIMR